MFFCPHCIRTFWSFESYGRHMADDHSDNGWEWDADEGVLYHSGRTAATT